MSKSSSLNKSFFMLLVLALLAGFVLAACSDNANNNNTNGTVNVTTSSSNTSTTATTAASTTTSGGSATVATTSNANNTSLTQNGGTSQVSTTSLDTAIQEVYKAAKPAVVLVQAQLTTEDNFGRTQTGQGVGTGSIITQDGYIVTNNHVVEGASQLTVAFTDNRRFPAKLVGRDPSNDVAVIKIDGQSNLPTIKIGDSDALQIGQWVVAIGNALGLPGGPTVTTGVISAKGRSISEENGANIGDLLQTDAAINPGNSGGPLLNLKGEMVGINTATAVDPEQGSAAQSIGFALSANQIKPIIDGFISGKPYVKPYMGINLTQNSTAYATRYNLKTDQGVLITQVSANSPAQKAGWKAGDIITEMDGQQIVTTSDLTRVLFKHKPGDAVNVKIVSRDGSEKQTQVTFAQNPNPPITGNNP